MGGYGSGRPVKYKHLVEDTLRIDVRLIKKQGLDTGASWGKLKYSFNGLTTGLRITIAPDRQSFTVHSHISHIQVQLLITYPQYGGVRYWFLSPCCGRRVYALFYLDERLACRTCLHLHYQSQRASAIERQRTYEKWLLLNYSFEQWVSLEHRVLTLREAIPFQQAGTRRFRKRIQRWRS